MIEFYQKIVVIVQKQSHKIYFGRFCSVRNAICHFQNCTIKQFKWFVAELQNLYWYFNLYVPQSVFPLFII